MKIIDVRDGFIKFEADRSVSLSSFIQVEGDNKTYIAQISQLKSFGSVVIAGAKILFLYKPNMLQNYDNSLPPRNAEIKHFSFEILSNTIHYKIPVIAGQTMDDNTNIIIDFSAFNKNMLISIDNKLMNNIIVRNLTKQFENIGYNTIIIDTLGVINAKKYRAGVDFKLPLNTSTLAFMYESCLNDVTSESKATITDIFKELAEYSKGVPFVPFSTLKNIVDEMVDKQHVFKLLVMKNKLAKFEKLGYFASEKKEVDRLQTILNSRCAVIDLSHLDTVFQNKYLSFIYENLTSSNNTQVLFEAANTISKKNLKLILSDSQTSTTFITHSRFQYLNDIKNLFDNFIIESTLPNTDIFKLYASFLTSMKKNMYLIAGESVNYIPIVSEAEIIDKLIPYNKPEPVKATDIANLPMSVPEVKDFQKAAENSIKEADISMNTNDNSSDNENEITNATDNPNGNISDVELIAAIDEKSNNAIDSLTQELETDDTSMELFTENVPGENDGCNDSVLNISDSQDDIENAISESNQTDIISMDINDELNSQEFAELNDEDLTDISYEDNVDEEEYCSDENYDDLDNSLIDNDTTDYIELDNDINQLIEEDSDEGIDEISLNNDSNDGLEEIQEVIPLSDEPSDELDALLELDSDETDENDIVVDLSNNEEQILVDEEAEQRIIKAVDKVYTTRKKDEEAEEISDSDLDFIDSLNQDEDGENNYQNELEEISDRNKSNQNNNSPKDDEILEKRDANTPIVPIYDAEIPQEDIVVSDAIQQGDAVIHTKYGNGIVEKMIKYGSKTLFAINFENVGRRLLDPTLTEIKRL